MGWAWRLSVLPSCSQHCSALWAARGTAGHSCINNHKNGDFWAEEGVAGKMNKETWKQLAKLLQVHPCAALWLQDPFMWWIRAECFFSLGWESGKIIFTGAEESGRTKALFALIGVNQKSFWLCWVRAAQAEQDLAYVVMVLWSFNQQFVSTPLASQKYNPVFAQAWLLCWMRRFPVYKNNKSW